MDWIGAYLEHKPFFDEMAKAMQKAGHRVGIITGEREFDPYNGADKKPQILQSLGFVPDFLKLWGQNETIGNGGLWKAQKMDEEDVYVHFDDDAKDIKYFTSRWVMKTMYNADQSKF